jgi:hypothetical protein
MALISSSFPGNDEKPAARARTRERATKNPARHAARAPGVVSVNTLFSKILVTRVKRKIELPLSLSINTGSRLFPWGGQNQHEVGYVCFVLPKADIHV